MQIIYYNNKFIISHPDETAEEYGLVITRVADGKYMDCSSGTWETGIVNNPLTPSAIGNENKELYETAELPAGTEFLGNILFFLWDGTTANQIIDPAFLYGSGMYPNYVLPARFTPAINVSVITP